MPVRVKDDKLQIGRKREKWTNGTFDGEANSRRVA